MRIFHCDRCGGIVAFAATACPTCGAELGYLTEQRAVRAVVPTSHPAAFRLGGDGADGGPRMWRCLNAAWGCNWMLPADTVDTWCRSCRLTRGRPDMARPDAIEAWMRAEAAKRRLVHQLDELALPIEQVSAESTQRLVFDLVHLPGEGAITGHLDGVVTFDLSETDDLHRDRLRRRMGEPFRTVIGHLRHEIGHYFWDRLVGQSDDLRSFRRVFGDERVDYGQAMDRYYDDAGGDWDRTRFLTGYATAHPLEDWAESFAHYLHILDVVDTAVAHDLVPTASAAVLVTDAASTLEWGDILDAWRPINAAVNAVAEALGAPVVYPFDPLGVAVDKLAFVHGQVAAHTERDRFYADR